MSQELALWVKKILVLVGILGILFLVYNAASILLILVISGFITILLNPLVEKGESFHVPAWITVIGVYVIIFLLGSVVIGNLVPIVINYISFIINTVIDWVNNAQNIYVTGWIRGFNLNPYIERLVLFLFGEENITHTFDIIKQNAGSIQAFFTNQISIFTSWSISVVSTVGGFITDWALIGVMVFLMVLERRDIGRFFLQISPDMSDYLRNHYKKIQHVGTAWIKAMIVLCFSIFFLTYIGLMVAQFIFGFHVEQTFVLAVISGIMEFIPYAWPILSLVLGVIIGLSISWEATLVIIVLYIIVQQIEGNFLVPYVMSKSLDLSPLFVFIVMLIGATLWGVLGIILAVPIAGFCKVVYDEYRKKRTESAADQVPVKWILRKKSSLKEE